VVSNLPENTLPIILVLIPFTCRRMRLFCTAPYINYISANQMFAIDSSVGEPTKASKTSLCSRHWRTRRK